MSRLPLREVSAPQLARLEELGAQPINLYRTLANQPDLLRAWVEFAWALRNRCETPRALRELVILRVAQLTNANYEWAAHVEMARSAGVTAAQIASLERWREATVFDAGKRTALEYAEAVLASEVTDAAFAALRAQFTDAAVVELTLTVSTYGGLAPLLAALKVPPDEGGQPPSPSRRSAGNV
jgi:AhpD family alkylhydroperoxidase